MLLIKKERKLWLMKVLLKGAVVVDESIIKMKRNCIINNTKHFSNLRKGNQRRTIIQILFIHTNIIPKKRGMLWEKLFETKGSPMPLFPISSRWKSEKYSTKKKLRRRLIIVLLILVLTWLSPFPKAKRHSKIIITTSALGSVPSILQT